MTNSNKFPDAKSPGRFFALCSGNSCLPWRVIAVCRWFPRWFRPSTWRAAPSTTWTRAASLSSAARRVMRGWPAGRSLWTRTAAGEPTAAAPSGEGGLLNDPGYMSADKFETWERINSERERKRSLLMELMQTAGTYSYMSQNFRLFQYRIYPIENVEFRDISPFCPAVVRATLYRKPILISPFCPAVVRTTLRWTDRPPTPPAGWQNRSSRPASANAALSRSVALCASVIIQLLKKAPPSVSQFVSELLASTPFQAHIQKELYDSRVCVLRSRVCVIDIDIDR